MKLGGYQPRYLHFPALFSKLEYCFRFLGAVENPTIKKIPDTDTEEEEEDEENAIFWRQHKPKLQWDLHRPRVQQGKLSRKKKLCVDFSS